MPGIRSPRVSFFSARFCSAEQQDQLAYRAILDQLASVGMTRRYGESRNFAARAANTFLQFNLLLRPTCHALWAQPADQQC